MNSKMTFDYYKELPAWAKGTVIVGGLGVTYMFASQIIKRIKQQAADRKAKASLLNAGDELKKLIDSGVNTTFPKSQFDAWAGQIKTQFSGCDFSATYYSSSLPFATNSFLLMQSIIKKLNNDADWLSLVTAFGVQTYDDCGLWNGNFTGDLPTCIADELTTAELDELNNTLASKGITYRAS